MSTHRLDTPKSRRYRARPLFGAVAALLIAPAAFGEVVNGAQLPDGAQKVGENRYRLRQNYEDAIKYYKNVYSTTNFPRRAIINQPGVKAIHIANPARKGFEGLNIYEANDEVRVYILAVEKPKPVKTKKKK